VLLDLRSLRAFWIRRLGDSLITSLKGASRDPELARYLKLVRAQRRLSPEEERRLALEFRNGDERAGEQLVLSNLEIVVKMAFRYHSRIGHVLDLVQEGNLGLVRALEKFDPTKGVPFSAYARYWVRAMILRYVMENHHAASPGNTREGRRLFWELARERQRLTVSGMAPTSRQLADALGASEQEVAAVSALSARELSLDEPVSTGTEGGRSLGDTLPDPLTPDPEDSLDRSRLVHTVRTGVATFAEQLGPRDRRILEARIVADEPATLGVLSEELGVSRERVRQLEARLRTKLGEALVEAVAPGG
jgi:RNA polymerase sigma-32 factor